MQILMAEDNPADVRLMQLMLREAEVPSELHSVPDGEEALAYLRHQGKYGDAKRPNLVLLDLNMPKRDGRSVLREVKADPDLRRIPIIVMTSSGAEEDIRQAYDAHANSYVRKSGDLGALKEIVATIERFWFRTAELPRA